MIFAAAAAAARADTTVCECTSAYVCLTADTHAPTYVSLRSTPGCQF